MGNYLGRQYLGNTRSPAYLGSSYQDGSSGLHWPTSPAEMAAVAGSGVWTSGYPCDEVSGNLTDFGGLVPLTAGSSPTYRTAGVFSGDYAIGFDSAADRFEAASAATFDLALGTSIAVFVCFKSSAPVANSTLFGKINPAGSNYWLGRCENASGHLALYTRSLTPDATVNTTLAVNHCDGAYHDVLFIIDRTGQRSQIVSDLGSSTATDISGVGTMANVLDGTLFSLGAQNSIGIVPLVANIAFLAVAVAGVDTLRANATTAISSLRHYTGR